MGINFTGNYTRNQSTLTLNEIYYTYVSDSTFFNNSILNGNGAGISLLDQGRTKIVNTKFVEN
jgi:parallel beta-helix repeat protein